MLELLRLLLPSQLLAPFLKPVTRLIVGFLAVPTFRLLMHRVVRLQDLDEELEKDLEQWFRGAILLLVATSNMESFFFGWVPVSFRDEKDWVLGASRLLLAIGVIEGMPDQALFSIIHPGPPKPKIRKGHLFADLRAYVPQFIRGFVCQYLSRWSPVLAIMTVVQPGRVGWVCYGMAIVQYLIIGLVTSRDRALDVLMQFDKAMAEQRAELREELHARGLSAETDRRPTIDDLTALVADAKGAEGGQKEVAETPDVPPPTPPPPP